MLVDVFSKGLRGKESEQALDRSCITVNKNAIPFDPNPPNVASGIRVGTPATTTRGFGTDEMREIASLIVGAIRAGDDAEARAPIAERVRAMCARFPVPGLPDA